MSLISGSSPNMWRDGVLRTGLHPQVRGTGYRHILAEGRHQFGAGIVNDDNRIIDWEEKPKVPRTNLASMGIYVFDYEYLLSSLLRRKDDIDFGMHILPYGIANDNVFAYPFYGYWRDVGTIHHRTGRFEPTSRQRVVLQIGHQLGLALRRHYSHH